MVLSSRSLFAAEFITRVRELGERNDLSLHHARTLLDCCQDWCRWHGREDEQNVYGAFCRTEKVMGVQCSG